MSEILVPKLERVEAKLVHAFIREYETYKGSHKKKAAPMASLLSADAKADLAWMAERLTEEALGRAMLEVEEDTEEGDTFDIEMSFKGGEKAGGALKYLLQQVVLPVSQSHAVESLADNKLSLREGLKDFSKIGPSLEAFKKAARSAEAFGASEKALLTAFEKNFLRHYPTLARSVKAANKQTLAEAVRFFAAETQKMDEAIQRVKNFQEDLQDHKKCVVCNRSGGARPKPPAKERLADKRARGNKKNEDKKKERKAKRQQRKEEAERKREAEDQPPRGGDDDSNKKAKRTNNFECLGCGEGLGENGKPLCHFARCKEGPWVVGEDFRLRHAEEDSKTPHRAFIPEPLRERYPAGFKSEQ